MKMRITSVLLLAVLGLGVIMCLPGVTNATTLFNNLGSSFAGGLMAVSQRASVQWVASSFGTGNASYVLDSVTLNMARTEHNFNGYVNAEVDIYTDDGSTAGAPGTKRGGALTLIGNIPEYPSSNFADVTFTASGITLNANSTYWVVLKAVGDNGHLEWSYTNQATHPYSLYTYDPTTTAPSSVVWHTWDISGAMIMKVEANPSAVPVPSGLLLLGAGLVRLAAFRRRYRG